MIDMNFSLSIMNEGNGFRQLNTVSDLNSHGKAAYDSFMFDSLINNFRSETIARESEKYNNLRSEGKNERPEQIDRDTEIDVQNRNDRSREVKRRSDQSERLKEDDNQNKDNRSEEFDGRSEKSDKCKENKNQNDSNKAALTDNDTEDSKQSQDFSGTKTDLKTSDLLLASLNENAEELIADSLVDDKEIRNNEETGNDLLSHLLNRSSEESNDNFLTNSGKVSEPSGNQTSEGEEDGSQTDVSLSHLLNGNLIKSADSQSDSIHNSENSRWVKSGLSKSENGLHMGSLLSDIANDSGNEEGDSVEEDLMNSQLKSVNLHSNDSKTETRELFNQTDKNTDVKQNYSKESQFLEEMAELDSQEGGNNEKALTNKIMSEFAGNFNREGVLRNYGNYHVRPVNVNSDNNNVNLLNNSHITHEGVRTNEGLFTGSATRASGFQELLDNIVYVIKGNNRLGVTVENENLGKLNINLSMDKGLVNVHINTPDKAIREFIENNMQYIVDSLSKNGVSVGGFSVALKDHKDNPGNIFIVNNGPDKEFIQSPENVRDNRDNSGLVNIFV